MQLARNESWGLYRRRMLDETARYIEWGLRHPDQTVEIPAKPAGEGPWPRDVSDWFWGVVLTERPAGQARRWLDTLLARPKGLFRRHRD